MLNIFIVQTSIRRRWRMASDFFASSTAKLSAQRATIRGLVTIVVVAMLASYSFGQDTRQTTGTIQGVVFTLDSKGERSTIQSAQIVPDGPEHLKTASQIDGPFAFGSVSPGNYKIVARAPGMAAAKTVLVVAGATSELSLELNLRGASQSAAIAGTANPSETNDPLATTDIGGLTVVNGPNADEPFDSVLPSIRAIAREPKGRVDLKGARDVQSDLLADNPNSTDPATGSTFDHAASMLQAQTGQLMGTVVDVRGDAIPGATIVLSDLDSPHSRTISTDENGFFEIDDVEPGVSSRIVVSAIGFNDWKSTLVLQPGQIMSLGGIPLELAPQNTTVTVRYDAAEVAKEQFKAEEKQRIFGIIPNFYVSYEGESAAPMTAKMKFQLALKASYDPTTIAGAALWAGIRQATDTPNYRQGLKGYGERFGAVSADGFSHIMIGDAILQSLLHEDPRYFYKGTGTTKSRLWHAFASPFWSRRDNDTWGPNYSNIGGDLASSALSNLYYPKSNRGAALFLSQFAIATGERVAVSVAEEFILSKFTRRSKNLEEASGQ